MSARTISIINNKGGVGKTTSTAVLSELLAYLGKRVLEIDLDQQSNLSMMMNAYKEDSQNVIAGIEEAEDYNVAELFKYRFRTEEEMEKIIKHTPIENLDIIPCSKRHKNSPVAITINQTSNNNIILKKALNCIKDKYDFILIDNAPAQDILTVNSMFASDDILVPVRMENFSYKGLKETLDSIAFIKEEHNITNANFLGVFITQAETTTNIYKDLSSAYESELKNKFFKTPIRKDIKIPELETVFRPILEYCPDTNVVFDYASLLLELNILDDKSATILKKSIGLE